MIFQSTPPVKAATTADCTERDTGKISIHAAREGGDYYSPVSGTSRVISIHAAREGGDNPKNMLFVCVIISIHAAREGGDTSKRERRLVCFYFNPRRP